MVASVKVEIDTTDVELGIAEVIRKIKTGAVQGMVEARNETYNEAMKGLLKFNHTKRKESIKGLVKKPIIYKTNNDTYSTKVAQISIAGKVLEYKGLPGLTGTGNSGVISLKNPNQKRAHVWLREKGLKSAKLSKNSQISPTGPMANVKPMEDAFNKFTLKKGPQVIANEIRKKLI